MRTAGRRKRYERLPRGTLPRTLLSLRTVCVRAAEHANNGDLLTLVVNSVEHAVGAAACAMAIVQRWSELLAHAVGIVEQWTDDELIGSERRRFGKLFGQLFFSRSERLSAHIVGRSRLSSACLHRCGKAVLVLPFPPG